MKTPEQLAAIKNAIDNLQSICPEGRAEVRRLVEAIIGRPLDDGRKAITSFNVGEKYRLNDGGVVTVLEHLRLWLKDSYKSEAYYSVSYSNLAPDGSGGPFTGAELLRWLNDHGAKLIGRFKFVEEEHE